MAAPIWEQALGRLSWSHGLVMAIYLAAAWLCLLNGFIARQAGETHSAWYLAATVLSLLGVNTLLQGDLLVTHLLRTLAKLEGWYGERRDVQYALVGLLALLTWPIGLRLRSAFTACDVASEPVTWGLTTVVMVFLLRLVSAHGTDALLNLRLLGVSLGRGSELAGLGLVIHGSLRCLRLR